MAGLPVNPRWTHGGDADRGTGDFSESGHYPEIQERTREGPDNHQCFGQRYIYSAVARKGGGTLS